MSQITSNLLLVKQRVELAALAAKRDPKNIQLLAVSKTFPAQDIEDAGMLTILLIDDCEENIEEHEDPYPDVDDMTHDQV